MVAKNINKPATSDPIERDVLPLYVEKKSRMIVEVQFYDNFVLIRPASTMRPMVYRVKLMDFVRDYEEFAGDYVKLVKYLRGDSESPLQGEESYES